MTIDSFVGITALNYSADADSRFREFRSVGVRIGTQDLRIASIVLASGGVLVTRNRQDFKQVPGLLLEDWSVE
ncbi:type II toxin-antitoxin system VapC family toxin [cf. Phormidesmis sp. LEGE 11477]|uniref:type II toxin-antitoxin system VapC family toxin n=1 Tax=cf. Phormidesmis sp. LEGE 11477 TaxID=1828680 RepID=UPI001D133D65|nr:type II toxin-antitoxin system VapC family toxin [cf. Phormidesmis sp. LEGE 11477]